MIKKTITYTDFNGKKQKEELYFNISGPEAIELEVSTNEGYAEMIQRVADSKNYKEIVQVFQKLILDAYGFKSEDGRSFYKDAEKTKAFKHSAAYEELFVELATDEKAATAFVNGVFPTKVLERLGNAGKKSATKKSSK